MVKHQCETHKKSMQTSSVCNCNETIIQDELHVLVKCNMYTRIREKYLPSIKHIKNNEEIGILLCKSTQENCKKLMMLVGSIEKGVNKEASQCRCTVADHGVQPWSPRQ